MSDEHESLPIVSSPSPLSTLWEEYKCCVISKQDGCFDQYNDDILQRLMTILSELPDIPLQSFIDNTKDTTTRLHSTNSSCSRSSTPQPYYLDDVLTSFIVGEITSFPRLVQMNRWSELSSSQVLDTNTVDESIISNWEKGLVLLSKVIKNISPFETHATITLNNFVPDDTNDCHHLGCQIYHTICILLCCQAIQQLSIDENTVSVSSSSSVRPRWQRCQSLLFETIRQYNQFHKLYIADKHQPMMMYHSLSIWIYHVLPSTTQWNCVLWGNDYFLQEQIRKPTNAVRIWRWRMACEAVTIAISGRLAIQVVTMEGNNGDALRSLVATIIDNVLFGQLDFICEHFWRFYYVVTLKREDVLQSYKDSLMTEYGPTATVAMMYFTLFAGKDDVDDESWDLLCGLSPTWSNTDIAILISVGWEIRPNMWSKTYQWHLFFPCINDLLLIGGVTDAIDDVESQRHHLSVAPYGYKLLSQLIILCPIRSIKKPSNDSAPDSPLGTFQLLFNVMVTQMDATKVDQRQCVVTATESFRNAKMLLNVFQPCSQIEMIEKLLLQCPYPSLRPKIVDLFRTFVDWNDRQGEGKVWSLIDKMFFVPLEDRLNAEMTLSNIGRLVDDSETYVAVLGLLHMWLKYKRSIPAFAQFDRLSDRLDHVHTSLSKMMHEFGISPLENQSNLQSPLQYFQLNLLEHGIRESIEAANLIQTYKIK